MFGIGGDAPPCGSLSIARPAQAEEEAVSAVSPRVVEAVEVVDVAVAVGLHRLRSRRPVAGGLPFPAWTSSTRS